MYSLRIVCREEEIESLSTALWEAGTAGIQELDYGRHGASNGITLIAGFETNEQRADLLRQFALYAPEWEQLDATDWVEETQRSWPGRVVGKRFFLAPPWCEEATPEGRLRLIHNPGLACGTGEHPCTQLALVALEERVLPGQRIADVGSGSGVLAIAALQLGAAYAVGVDIDEAALAAARENFELNQMTPLLAVGSADCLADGCADVVVANISATVIISMAGDLLGLLAPKGELILTGFQQAELAAVRNIFATSEIISERVSSLDGWRCLCLQFAS